MSDRKVLKAYKKIMLGMFALILLAVIVLGVFTRADDFIRVTEDNRLLFEPEGGEAVCVALSELDSIDLKDTLSITDDGDGQSGKGYTYGEGVADGIGPVRYYAYDRTDRFIVIRNGGDTIAFNYYNNQNTEDFCRALTELMEEQQNES